ncbi:MAG: S1/P1 nuclease [Gammaproteobacteria bacterium]
MHFRNWLSFITLIAAMTLSSPALSFGPDGHRIVAQLAEKHLTPRAQSAILKITKGKHLARLATWPDRIRSRSAWKHTKPWHYLSIDDDESFNDYSHSKDGDILVALAHFEQVLMDKKTSPKKMWQALAFYTHFVGDIHQPLHVGRRDDYGGNSIHVKWFNKRTNLHAVWDSKLIDYASLTVKEYVTFLDKRSETQIKTWQNSTYLDWAKESKCLRHSVYEWDKPTNKRLSSKHHIPNLSHRYADQHKKLIDEQLAKGGIRLAGKLNQIFQ